MVQFEVTFAVLSCIRQWNPAHIPEVAPDPGALRPESPEEWSRCPRGKPMLGYFDVTRALPVAETVGAVREPEDESDIGLAIFADCASIFWKASLKVSRRLASNRLTSTTSHLSHRWVR